MASVVPNTKIRHWATALWFLVGLQVVGLSTTKAAVPDGLGDCACIDSKASLLHLGSLDSFDITEIGTEAAKLLLDSIETGNKQSAKRAWDIYEKIIPNENFGGEYVALQWFCEYFMATAPGRQEFLTNPYVTGYFDFLAQDEFAELKGFIRRKYHLDDSKTADSPALERKQRFYEDFILFNNPRRDRWEKSGKIVEVLGLRPGDVVADVGSGSGYFSFRFAELVGNAGKVFAIDTNKPHVEYVTRLAQRLGINNVQPLQGRIDGFDLDTKVDYVFLCSLYHILYGYVREEQREPFIASIKRVLKDEGRLIVVDNALVDDATLPYHGPYIAKELIVGQLRHFGFTLEAVHQFIPQRYVLVFKPTPKDAPVAGSAQTCGKGCIPIDSRASLVNMGLADERPSPGGKAAGAKLLKALESKDRQDIQAARDAYAELMRKENFGNEYSGFLWFCDYLLATAEDRHKFTGKYTDDFAQFFTANDFEHLKRNVKARFLREEKVPESLDAKIVVDEDLDVTSDQLLFWTELLQFSNPNRTEWEKTDQILDFIGLKKGATVVDVGSGSGYFSFRFADLVGPEGKVFATETNKNHREYVTTVAKRYGLSVETVEAKLDNVNVPPNTADMIFMGSLYDAVYAFSMEAVKNRFMESVKACLKADGQLIIMDHDHVDPPHIPYHGPQIDKRLIIEQLRHYGFKLVRQQQIIPQRYVLVFEHAPTDGRASDAAAKP